MYSVGHAHFLISQPRNFIVDSIRNGVVLNEYLQNGLMVSNNSGIFHANSLKHAVQL